MSRQIEGLTHVFHPHPSEAREGTLDNFVYRRLYEDDPSAHPGTGIPYYEALVAAMHESTEQRGQLPLRIAQVSALILGDIRTHMEQGTDQPQDLTALSNLSFIVPHFPQSYAQRAIADDLRVVGSVLLDRPDEEQKHVSELLLDSLNSLPAMPGDEKFWWDVWSRPYGQPAWAAAFVGLSRSSVDQAVRALPQAVERAENGWESEDAFWAFYSLHLEGGVEGRRIVAFGLRRLQRGALGKEPENFNEMLAGTKRLLVEAGAPIEHVEEVEDRLYVDAAGWATNPDEYFARREKLYPRARK